MLTITTKLEEIARAQWKCNLVTLITCTGSRPEALRLCCEWMTCQTYTGPVQWLIVDDGEEKTAEPLLLDCFRRGYFAGWDVQIIRTRPFWREGDNTQRRNMMAALQSAKGDVIFTIEDDDYYAPGYIDHVLNLMRVTGAYVVGEGGARYYNLPTQSYKRILNHSHAALASTAVRREQLPLFFRAVNSGHTYFDIELWRLVGQLRVKNALQAWSTHSVGIKGLPGRGGIGAGHRPGDHQFEPDIERQVLKQWLGDDAAAYERFLSPAQWVELPRALAA